MRVRVVVITAAITAAAPRPLSKKTTRLNGYTVEMEARTPAGAHLLLTSYRSLMLGRLSSTRGFWYPSLVSWAVCCASSKARSL